MSGLKPIALTQFYRKLHARGLDVTTLARELHCGRSHLSQVLSGRRPGRPTLRKLEQSGLLTAEEQALLASVPRATKSHMGQIHHAPAA